MPEPEPVLDDDTPPAPTGPPCLHLRSKGMYVYTDMPADDLHEDDGATAYWCLKTMKEFGPDDGLVGRRDCRDPGRSCYEPT
jgi:hypothetical protein